MLYTFGIQKLRVFWGSETFFHYSVGLSTSHHTSWPYLGSKRIILKQGRDELYGVLPHLTGLVL